MQGSIDTSPSSLPRGGSTKSVSEKEKVLVEKPAMADLFAS